MEAVHRPLWFGRGLLRAGRVYGAFILPTPTDTAPLPQNLIGACKGMYMYMRSIRRRGCLLEHVVVMGARSKGIK